MKHYTKSEIEDLERFTKVNFTNSLSGYRSANLIGTKNSDGISNLAIFNSVGHLGSSPAMLQFLLRPHTVDRHTYENILETKYFTINSVSASMISQAHATSAKFDREVSEFEATGLTEDYKAKFWAPFVKESPLQIGCKYLNTYEIAENGCLLVLGEVVHVFVDEKLQTEDGFLNLDKAETVCINGLDQYLLPKPLERYEYARIVQNGKSISKE